MGGENLLGFAHPRFAPLPQPTMIRSLSELEEVLSQVGAKVRRQSLKGIRGLLTSCPCLTHGKGYGDRNPSLWIGFSSGRWFFHCFASCGESVLLRAFQELNIIFSSEMREEGEKKIVQTRDYVIFDGEGKTPIAIHRRFEYADGSKGFQWLAPDGSKGLKLKVSELPLYRSWDLPSGAEAVWVVEGEKCCETLWEVGELAVAIYGSQALPGERSLRLLLQKLSPNARIYLCPDGDAPGREAMDKIAKALLQQDFYEVFWVDLGEDGGYDVVDFLETNPPEKLQELKRNAVPYLPPLPTASTLLQKQGVGDFLIEDLLPKGGLTFLVARPKVGKSLFAVYLAKAVLRGENFLGFLTERGKVLYLDYERAPLTAERCISVGIADEIYLIQGSLNGQWLSINNLAYLKAVVKKYGIKLVIIDTVLPFLELKGESDLNSYSKVYPLLLRFKQFALETNCSFLLVHHLRKTSHEGIIPELEMLGTTALSAVADLIVSLTRKGELIQMRLQGNFVEEKTLSFIVGESELLLAESEATTELEEAQKVIWEFLRKRGVSSRKEILDWVSTFYPYKKHFALSKLVDRALKRMLLEGKLKKAGTTRNAVYELALLENPSTVNLRGEENVFETSSEEKMSLMSLKPQKQEMTRDRLETFLETSPSDMSLKEAGLNSVFETLSKDVSKMSQKNVSNLSKENSGFQGFETLETSKTNPPVSKQSHPFENAHEPSEFFGASGSTAPPEPGEAVGSRKINNLKSYASASSSSGSSTDPYAHLFHPQALEWLNALAKDPSLKDRQVCPGCKKEGVFEPVFKETGEIWLFCNRCGSLFMPQIH